MRRAGALGKRQSMNKMHPITDYATFFFATVVAAAAAPLISVAQAAADRRAAVLYAPPRDCPTIRTNRRTSHDLNRHTHGRGRTGVRRRRDDTDR
jgi:hypothetical protein